MVTTRLLRVEPTRTFHGKRKTVESEPRGYCPAQLFDFWSKTSITRSRESQPERGCTVMWGKSPHDRTAGRGRTAEARTNSSPRALGNSPRRFECRAG